MSEMSRRGMLGGLAAGVAAAAPILGARSAEAAPALKKYGNTHFYTDGKFDAAKANAAYYEMMEHYSYPIPPRLRTDEFWTLDFALGKFTEVGMAGIFWINDHRGFFGHEIYLLPGQMIPEHLHLSTKDGPAKMEGWHVRHGSCWVFGNEGASTPEMEALIPPSHKQCSKARIAKKLMPGECACLNQPCAPHFMLAGPQGAIVSEYANWHDNAGLRFSHPDVKFG
ncbi:MAG: hypothetical protein ISS72_02905 [Candidatus Brocadiae bacterium]|nr:hypothetical protein [Candidatus Brocadiia bacterium]